jgi:hypothetical protein
MFLERSFLLVALGSLLQLTRADDACADGTCKSALVGTEFDSDLQQDILLLQQQKELQAQDSVSSPLAVQHDLGNDASALQREELLAKQAKRRKHHERMIQVNQKLNTHQELFMKVRQNLSVPFDFPKDFDPDSCDEVLQDMIHEAGSVSGILDDAGGKGMDPEQQTYCMKYAAQYGDQSVVPEECIIFHHGLDALPQRKIDLSCCMYEIRCSDDSLMDADACSYEKYGAPGWQSSIWGPQKVDCVGSQTWSPVPMGVCKCKVGYCTPQGCFE